MASENENLAALPREILWGLVKNGVKVDEVYLEFLKTFVKM